MVLVDKYGRPLQHLRISITNSCNYRCLFCHMEGIEESRTYLTPEEIRIIAEVATELGIRKFKITGGEPLLRPDIVRIVKLLSELKPLDLGITTNGYYLTRYIEKLVDAGLMRVNVNLPTLRREKYKLITGIDGLEHVIKGLRIARELNLKLIKINYVVLRNLNDDEFWDLVKFARDIGAILQVIELEPIGISSSIYEKYFKSVKEFEAEVRSRAIKFYTRSLHARPVYHLEDGSMIEFVRWFCNPKFCANCTRIRLTPDGILKPCILSTRGVNLVSALRPKPDRELIRRAFFEVNRMREPYFKYQKISLL